MQAVEFWIEYGSTYTYLAVARIGDRARAAGVELRWQPFLVMPIMAELGLSQGPFLPFPAKTAYMWRDIERRAAVHGVTYRRPSIYPVNMLLTARVGCVAAAEGWCQAFTEGVFRLHWTQDRPIGSEDNLHTVLSDLGHEPAAVIARAQQPATKDALRRQTERAKALGVFGAPSFTVGDELFWGDDRLEEALAWAQAH